ncbi:MAG: hypothetical protein KDK70_23260 [Myxococcales bacterium]|nr:hypothetical protein [Myxococcales bacterium]
MLETTTNTRRSADPTPSEPAASEVAEHGILVRSIGTAGAAIVGALGSASRVPEQMLAQRLFQAPAMLFRGLTKELAEEATAILRAAGVECEVTHQDHSFTPGGADHEVALVVRDFRKTSAVLESVMTLLGVTAAEAKRILCTSPAVLLGRISAATVVAIEQRFAPLGVEVDVSRPATARFDVLMGHCNAEQRAAAVAAIGGLHIEVESAREDHAGPLLAMGISHDDAERVHAIASRSQWPLVVVNRDFQRYDVRLDAAPDTPRLRAFLAESAGMPERMVPRVLARLPIVTHPCVRFSRMGKLLESMRALGASASGHLLSFQAFSLRIDRVGDVEASSLILRGIGGLSKEDAERALTSTKEVPGPLSPTLARWARHELENVGTTCRLVLP